MPKHSCLDDNIDKFLTPENGLGEVPEDGGPPFSELEVLGGLDMRAPSGCQARVCRLLCATPSIEITPYYSAQFNALAGPTVAGGAVSGIPAGVCDLIDGKRPDACFVLNRTLHVGETLEFELQAKSVLSEDLVDVQGAVEPGIPIGMDFADAGSMPGIVG